MKGVCFESVRRVSVRTLADPVIERDHDAIVRVDMAGLCGSDLHPFFGRETGMDAGTVMGHEFVGSVVACGDAVTKFRVGDKVGAPFTTNCGQCYFCQAGLTSRCDKGELFGWRQQGSGLHGGQAEYVRVPLADSTLMKIPHALTDETAILLGDNLSTGHFAAELVDVRPDGVYLVIGCGTVGLLSIVSAFRLGATRVIAIDPNQSRVDVASELGADAYVDAAEAESVLRDVTEGRGADGVMELVGLPEAQSLAYRLIRPGGTMSVIGCHCTPNFAFSPSDAYDKSLTYRTGRCPARHYMSQLLDGLIADPIDLSWCVTHRFDCDSAEEAYETFSSGADRCIKAVFTF